MLATERQHGYLARQIGTLALSHVEPVNPMALVRAASWHNSLGRLGLHLPLFVIHDLGVLLTAPAGAATVGPRQHILNALKLPVEARGLLRQYHQLIVGISESEIVQKASSWRLRDELVAVLLGRVLGDIYLRHGDPSKAVGSEPLPLDPGTYQEATPDDVARHFGDYDPAPLWAFVRFVIENRLQIYTAIEQIDLDTLKLLGLFDGGASAALDLVDLYGVFASSDASDVVDFSLELLPSVLETKRASGVQTFAVDGYASIETRGSPDSLLLTEFAWEEELFERKVIDDELYYYGRERQREEQRRLQYILVDSSPSMRGTRQVFARGLALALAKKLALQGDEVWLRFFDSRLYDLQKFSTPAGSEAVLPYLLCFKSERGRNYGKVFRQLLVELTRLRAEESRRVVVYIITHGQCHLPVELVEQLARCAFLYGVFILPSSEVRLEYLAALNRYQIVDGAALGSREGRRGRALDIIEDAGNDPRPGRGGARVGEPREDRRDQEERKEPAEMRQTYSVICPLMIAAACALPSAAEAKPKDESAAARAECKKMLDAQNLDGLRIAWTKWQSREMSSSVEIKHGKLARLGGSLRNARKERSLTDAEKKTLLGVLTGAHVDRLVWINRDVKNDMDRILNVDVVKPDGSLLPVGAFVRTHQIWHMGATKPLADLLEQWLGEN